MHIIGPYRPVDGFLTFKISRTDREARYRSLSGRECGGGTDSDANQSTDLSVHGQEP